jgi:hypothetical protein
MTSSPFHRAPIVGADDALFHFQPDTGETWTEPSLFDAPDDSPAVKVGGWTATGRYLGKCKCGRVARIDRKPSPEDSRLVTCEDCRQTVRVFQVFGSRGPRKCDARCMNATGPDCDCSCAGANHGANR